MRNERISYEIKIRRTRDGWFLFRSDPPSFDWNGIGWRNAEVAFKHFVQAASRGYTVTPGQENTIEVVLFEVRRTEMDPADVEALHRSQRGLPPAPAVEADTPAVLATMRRMLQLD